jgi:hypothetical protein
MRPYLHFALLVVHIWATAIYWGALSYSYLRLYPQMREFLESEERFEQFAITVGAGLRWWVFGTFMLIGVSGAALAAVSVPATPSAMWRLFIAAKVLVLVELLAVYAYASWVMWPERIFAAPADLPRIRKRFTAVSWVIGSSFLIETLLGVAIHVW